MVGLERGKVKSEQHKDQWKEDYREEVTRLKLLLGEDSLDFEHIGSTAIKEIKAKPIIDMILVVDNLERADEIISVLEDNGYELRPNDDVEGRILLAKGPRKERTHYLSLTEEDSGFYQRTTSFRDYLNSHPRSRNKYNRLKREFASKHPEDRDKYTEKKSEFIERIIGISRN
jgi:GrpB-like predicted nucleotidyltransferase (UPF0157 family)